MRKSVRGVVAVMAVAPMLFLATPAATASSGKPAAVSAANVDMKIGPGCGDHTICFGDDVRWLFYMTAGEARPQLPDKYNDKVVTAKNWSDAAVCLYEHSQFAKLLAKVEPKGGVKLRGEDRKKTSSIRPC